MYKQIYYGLHLNSHVTGQAIDISYVFFSGATDQINQQRTSKYREDWTRIAVTRG